MSPRLRRLRNAFLALALTGCGLWLAGGALWQAVQTAIYVHKSVVVTGTVIDVRQKPFESWSETLGKGNWSSPGDVSYQPIVSFQLPDGINAIRYDFAADNVDYRIGDGISIISPPGQPGKAHINRWKFLWGATCMQLGLGALLGLMGWYLLRRMRGKRPAQAASPAKAATPTPAANHKAANPPAPTAAKAPRKRKSASGTTPAPSTPRRRKKAASSSPADTPKKPRRSRKKSDTEQMELPL